MSCPGWLFEHLQVWTQLNRKWPKKQVWVKENLTLHADFVLSGARVRDEIHLHRHLPHRSVGWLTWTHTKTTTGELEKRHSENRNGEWRSGREEWEPGRGIERSGNRNKREKEDKRTESKTVGAAFLCTWGIQELIQKMVCKHFPLCVKAKKLNPRKNTRGVDMFPPYGSPVASSQGFL